MKTFIDLAGETQTVSDEGITALADALNAQLAILRDCMTPQPHTRLLVWKHDPQVIDWLLEQGYLSESKREPSLYKTTEKGAQASGRHVQRV